MLISFQACLQAFAKSIQTSCKLTAPTSDLVPVDLVSPDKPLAMKPGSAAKVLPTVFIKTYRPHAEFLIHGLLRLDKFHTGTHLGSLLLSGRRSRSHQVSSAVCSCRVCLVYSSSICGFLSPFCQSRSRLSWLIIRRLLLRCATRPVQPCRCR